MAKQKQWQCIFCGKIIENYDEPDIVVPKSPKLNGPNGRTLGICRKCLNTAYDFTNNMSVESDWANLDWLEDGFSDEISIKTPEEIKKILDDYIIGQDRAKKELAIALYNHLKVREYNKKKKDEDIDIDKSNILLVGPTGSGKTYLLKTLSRILNVPFAEGNGAEYTAAGYSGEDLVSVLSKLVDNADGDIQKAEYGIVYIDEFDKLGKGGKHATQNREISCEAVQQELLKMIEGTVVNVPKSGSRRKLDDTNYKLNTKNILFILGGCFDGITDIIKARTTKNTKKAIGFVANMSIEGNVEKCYNDYIDEIKTEDLLEYGILNEVIGRLPIIVPLHELDIEALENILVKPKNAIIKQYQQIFKLDNVTLKFQPKAIKAIAQKAHERKIGARGLRSIVEECLKDIRFTIPSDKNIYEVVVTEQSVLNNEKPLIKEQTKNIRKVVN